MRKGNAALAACVVIVLGLGLGVGLGTESPGAARPTNATVRAKPGALRTEGKGYRFDSNGWVFLHLEGGPFERGFQNGRLMAKEIETSFKDLAIEFLVEQGLTWDHLSAAAQRLFASKVDPEFTEELRGISEGMRAAGVDGDIPRLLALNGYIELVAYWWPAVKSGRLADIEEVTRCSAFIATGSYTADRKPVIAHNTWSSFLEAQGEKVIVDLKPDTGHRILMQSGPGLIHSMTDFFVTDARIMGTETTISGIDSFDPNGTPEFVRARRAMQYAGNLDEFVSIMRKGNNGAYANTWLLADAQSGEILRFEQGLEIDDVDRTKDGYFCGYNGPDDAKLRNLEASNTGYFNVKDSVGARRVRLDRLMAKNRGRIDVERAKAIISDHYDVYLRKFKPGVRTVEGRGDLDPRKYGGGTAYYPAGAVDGKAMDARQALAMSFVARWGSSSGLPFDADAFLRRHPQFNYMKGFLLSRPTRPWTLFRAGQR